MNIPKKSNTACSLGKSELAEIIGTNANTVIRRERGITNPSTYYRRKLAELFGVDPQALFPNLNAEKASITERTLTPSEQEIEVKYSTQASKEPL